MSNILKEATSALPDVHEKANFNSNNIITMLQGLVGFTAAADAKDPLLSLTRHWFLQKNHLNVVT